MKKTVRILALLLAVTCILFCGGGTLSQKTRVEGGGFDSPEEALIAYAEALKAGDMDGMLRTFCVETYCEKYDTQAYLENLGMINPTGSIYVPANGDPFLERLNREVRQDEIMDNTLRQFRIVSLLGTGYEELLDGSFYQIEDESDAAGLLTKLSDTTPFSTMSIGDIVTPEALAGTSMESESMGRQVERLLSWYGADEMAFNALRLRIMGGNWLLMMDAVRYGDRWYNVNSMGLLATLLNLSVYTGGLAPESEIY